MKRSHSRLRVYETFAAERTLTALVERSVRAEGRRDGGKQARLPHQCTLMSLQNVDSKPGYIIIPFSHVARTCFGYKVVLEPS